MQSPDGAGQSGRRRSDKPSDGPQRNADQVWAHQISASFLFSPYFTADPEKALTSAAILGVARNAETLLGSLAGDFEKSLPEAIVFLRENAQSIVNTVVNIGLDDKGIASIVTHSAFNTQKRLAEFGELGASEVERATMVCPPSEMTARIGGVAAGFLALSLGDASAALAALRAGLPADFGRGVFAAELVLELRDTLNAKL